MSATGRSEVRHADDWYATPHWVTHAILPILLRTDSDAEVLDPACGDGAILDAVKAFAPRVRTTGFEINPSRAETARVKGHEVHCVDALSKAAESWAAPVLIMNPPFSLAMPFVERAVAGGRVVAALLRLSWLASQRRQAFHREHPSDVYVLHRRPSFTGKGTDSCDYAWFCWGPRRGGRWEILDIGSDGGGK